MALGLLHCVKGPGTPQGPVGTDMSSKCRCVAEADPGLQGHGPSAPTLPQAREKAEEEPVQRLRDTGGAVLSGAGRLSPEGSWGRASSTRKGVELCPTEDPGLFPQGTADKPGLLPPGRVGGREGGSRPRRKSRRSREACPGPGQFTSSQCSAQTACCS